MPPLSAARYAIYYAPSRDSLLWQLGVRWLGRDPETGAEQVAPAMAGYRASEVAAYTQSARRYGWHATIKAPFRLRPQCSGQDLAQALAAFCATRDAIPLPALEVGTMGAFIALRPLVPYAELNSLAAACVETFENYRQPPSEQEQARRRAAGLSERQQWLLERYGYPYVLDEFRFHLTLTDALPMQTQTRLLPALATHFAPALEQPCMLDQFALFVEPAEHAPLALLQRYRLGTR